MYRLNMISLAMLVASPSTVVAGYYGHFNIKEFDASNYRKNEVTFMGATTRD